MLTMKECVEEYARRRGISKAQAETEFKEAVAVIVSAVAEGGFSVKSQFTIKKKVQKGRSGSFNGKEWKTEDRNTLSISVGKELASVLNQ